MAELARGLQALTGDHAQVAFVDQGYTGADGVHLEVVKPTDDYESTTNFLHL